MTGFARASGHGADVSWVWEAKSVNSKTFDVRLRLPTGLEHLDAPVRQSLAKAFKRGSLQVNLSLQGAAEKEQISINQEVLGQYVAMAKGLQDELGAAPFQIEGLLALRGVVEAKATPRSEDQQVTLDTALLASFEAAVTGLNDARKAEGKSLGVVLTKQLEQIERLHAAAVANPSRQPEAIRARLKAQVAQLIDIAKLDETRLAQEAALLMTRADIQEELDRLAVHIAAARSLLNAPEPVGRKFDFLAQEFNREANTLCSKANDSSLTSIGLDLKTVIDQMREQVQNIE